jgi:hypothetical protein
MKNDKNRIPGWQTIFLKLFYYWPTIHGYTNLKIIMNIVNTHMEFLYSVHDHSDYGSIKPKCYGAMLAYETCDKMLVLVFCMYIQRLLLFSGDN